MSANAFGAAIGAILGGPLCDRFGRKAIYTYDLLVYMVGMVVAAFAVDYRMLLVAFVITGMAVGAGVPASWTYIAEQAPSTARAKHVGTAQLAWSVGPLIGFALAAVLAPLGLLGSRIIFLHLFLVAAVLWWVRQGLAESQIWTDEGRYADRMSQRVRYVIGAALGVVAWVVLVAFTDSGVPTMLAFAVLWGVSSGIGAQAFYSLWASELLIGALGAPATRGKTLQQIEVERYSVPVSRPIERSVA